jgi:hypothetical protein
MSGLRSIVLKNPLGRQGRTTVATTMRGPVELARHMWRRAVSERGRRQSWPHLGRFIHKERYRDLSMRDALRERLEEVGLPT